MMDRFVPRDDFDACPHCGWAHPFLPAEQCENYADDYYDDIDEDVMW